MKNRNRINTWLTAFMWVAKIPKHCESIDIGNAILSEIDIGRIFYRVCQYVYCQMAVLFKVLLTTPIFPIRQAPSLIKMRPRNWSNQSFVLFSRNDWRIDKILHHEMFSSCLITKRSNIFNIVRFLCHKIRSRPTWLFVCHRLTLTDSITTHIKESWKCCNVVFVRGSLHGWSRFVRPVFDKGQN